MNMKYKIIGGRRIYYAEKFRSEIGIEPYDYDYPKTHGFHYRADLNKLPKKEHAVFKNNSKICEIELASFQNHEEYGYKPKGKGFILYDKNTIKILNGVDAIELLFTSENKLMMLGIF